MRFTSTFDDWRPPSGRPDDGPKAIIESGVGGRWFERDASGQEFLWGYVLEWNPPQGLTLSWQVGLGAEFDPALRTEVDVTFAPLSSTQCLVSIEHRCLEHFGHQRVQAQLVLASATGWAGMLRHFAQHCAPRTSAASQGLFAQELRAAARAGSSVPGAPGRRSPISR